MILKYWRVWLLVVMILGSITAIGLKSFPQGREGVVVSYVSRNSPAKNILAYGMVITQLNNEKVKGVEDWGRLSLSKGNVSLTANGHQYSFNVNDTIGVNVIGIERTNLDFGLDLKGGTRIILKPQENASEDQIKETIGILETRANLFGLREIKFFQARDITGQYFIQIEAAGVGNEIVDEILSKQGRFEAKIIKPAKNSLQIGSEFFTIEDIGNDSLRIDGRVVNRNSTFTLKGIEFEYANKTVDGHLFLAKIYDGKDVEFVYTDPQRSGVLPQGNAYQFFFQVLISQAGSQRFADVTAGIPKLFDVSSGDEYLDSSFLLYLDDNLVSSLRISGDLGGKIVQSPQVTGSGANLEEALKEKLRLQTILKSGAPPVHLSIESVDVISPTLGAGFFNAAMVAGLVAAIVVASIIFARYRSLKTSIPLTLIGISESIIILGIAATNDALIWGLVLLVNLAIIVAAWVKKYEVDVSAWIGAVLIPLLGMVSWTIDLPAIAGVVAVIGTGVDHLIIIFDQTLKEKVLGIKHQLKTAFFIVFAAAATVIAAMIPLMFVGVGLLRGFAITTVVGVLVGVLVSRPAYAKIVEVFSQRTPKPEKEKPKPSPSAKSSSEPVKEGHDIHL